MTNGNAKGKSGERELAAELTRLFGEPCRRSQQYCGEAGDADIIGLPGIHPECKRTEALRLWDAIQQASDECGDNVPVVFHRANRKPWIAVVRLDDLPRLATILFHVLSADGSVTTDDA